MTWDTIAMLVMAVASVIGVVIALLQINHMKKEFSTYQHSDGIKEAEERGKLMQRVDTLEKKVQESDKKHEKNADEQTDIREDIRGLKSDILNLEKKVDSLSFDLKELVKEIRMPR